MQTKARIFEVLSKSSFTINYDLALQIRVTKHQESGHRITHQFMLPWNFYDDNAENDDVPIKRKKTWEDKFPRIQNIMDCITWENKFPRIQIIMDCITWENESPRIQIIMDCIFKKQKFCYASLPILIGLVSCIILNRISDQTAREIARGISTISRYSSSGIK